MKKLNQNQIVLVEGYVAIVKAVYKNHCEVSINFHGKIVNTVVEICKIKKTESKAKYSKDDQLKMFGRVFSTGFIQMLFVHLDFENVWGLIGDAVRISTPCKCDMIPLSPA